MARRWGRFAGLAVGAAALGTSAWALRDVPVALGRSPSAERVRHSPQYRDGKFHNSTPTTVMAPGTMTKTAYDLFRDRQQRTPSRPVPVLRGPLETRREGLHITWYGHASALVEMDGHRILLDPVWSERCSPSQLMGPRRLHPMPIALVDLPRLDAIVISHDHYDHLDMATVKALARAQTAPFLVPLGVGAHLEHWGLEPARIIELDWDETATIAGIRLTMTAARHFSGRGFARDNTLWGSWVLAGRSRSLFYSGDTGFFDDFVRIGATHGPFDVSLVQVGAYGDGWPDVHLTPEDGVRAHIDVRAGLMIPVHWGTFVLALHDWSEPVERVWREAKLRSVALAVPRPGERIDVDAPPEVDGWWQDVA